MELRLTIIRIVLGYSLGLSMPRIWWNCGVYGFGARGSEMRDVEWGNITFHGFSELDPL